MQFVNEVQLGYTMTIEIQLRNSKLETYTACSVIVAVQQGAQKMCLQMVSNQCVREDALILLDIRSG